MPIKAVYFDLGRVLVDFDWSRAATRLEGIASRSAGDLVDTFVRSDTTRAYETGRIQSDEFLSRLSEHCGVSDIAFLREVWSDIFTIIPSNINLPTMLSRSCFVGLISNTCPMHIEWLRSRLGLLNDFHRTIYSYELGFLKPDPAVYRAAVQGQPWQASDILFIDDLEENVAGALQMGWNAIHYRKSDDLRALIEGYGLRL